MEVTNNTKNLQFEIKKGDHKAELQYRFRKKTMFFMHTWVPEPLEGQGVASAMAKTGLEYAKEKGYKIAVMCPFVAGYIKRHPEYRDLIDTEYHQKLWF